MHNWEETTSPSGRIEQHAARLANSLRELVEIMSETGDHVVYSGQWMRAKDLLREVGVTTTFDYSEVDEAHLTLQNLGLRPGDYTTLAEGIRRLYERKKG